MSIDVDLVKENYDSVMKELSGHIVGQQQIIKQIMIGIFSNGHVLLVGVPGLAKTLMVKTVAQTMDLSFKRIQFTPDLMPSDITGTMIIQEDVPGKREFKFVKGPIFANIVLADEINRTPPKTQAALLESMQEKQVTSGATTYQLPQPFFVIATQNPIEQEGTYPLPEAQLDRFMLNVIVSYPAQSEEELIYQTTTKTKKTTVKSIMNSETVSAVQKVVESISVSNYIVSYVAKLVRSTRPKEKDSPEFIKKTVEWGAGPRAGQHIIQSAKASAAMDGRTFVSVQDIREVAVPAMRHRLATNFQAQMQGLDSAMIVKKLLETIPEPKVAKYE